MTIQQKIDMACAHAGISKSELSRRLGYNTPQAFHKRYKYGNFSQEELEKIADVINGEYISYFHFSDGTKI